MEGKNILSPSAMHYSVTRVKSPWLNGNCINIFLLQSVPITTKVVRWILSFDGVYSVEPTMIQITGDFRQVGVSICGHLWHRYINKIYQVMKAAVETSK